jgi:hypothetical protein
MEECHILLTRWARRRYRSGRWDSISSRSSGVLSVRAAAVECMTSKEGNRLKCGGCLNSRAACSLREGSCVSDAGGSLEGCLPPCRDRKRLHRSCPSQSVIEGDQREHCEGFDVPRSICLHVCVYSRRSVIMHWSYIITSLNRVHGNADEAPKIPFSHFSPRGLKQR